MVAEPGAESPGNLGRPAGAGAAAGPAGPSGGSGDEWELLEVHRGWRRVARSLRKLFRLRSYDFTAEVQRLGRAAWARPRVEGLVLQPRAESFVDTRALGKPDMFMGEEHKWNDWKEIFKAYCGVVNADLLAGMRLAESADEASVQIDDFIEENMRQASQQLYYILLLLCRQHPLTTIANAGENEGFQAWRKLVEYYEPTARSRIAGQLLNLMNFTFTGDVEDRLALFERELLRCEQRSGEAITAPMRIGIVLRQLEVTDVRRAQSAIAPVPVPMDLSAFTKGDGKGKSRGDGKGKGKSSGKGKSKGDSKGKSKSDGKGKTGSKSHGQQLGPLCWGCGGHGHTQRECPSKHRGTLASMEQTLARINASQSTSKTAPSAASSISTAATTRLSPATAMSGAISRQVAALYLNDAGEQVSYPFANFHPLITYDPRPDKEVKLNGILRAGIDSCAAASVLPRGSCADYPVHEGGQAISYKTAPGHYVNDESERNKVYEMDMHVDPYVPEVCPVEVAGREPPEGEAGQPGAAHEEVAEGPPARPARGPAAPTAAERAAHEVLHELYRARCRECVSGRGLSAGHQSKDRQESALAVVGIDYGYLGEREDAAPLLVGKDSKQRWFHASVVPSMGTQHPWQAKSWSRRLASAGRKRFVFRSDGGAPLVALKTRVGAKLKKEHGVETVPEESAVGDSQGNGLAEHAAREVKAKVRAARAQVDDLHGVSIGVEHPVTLWMVEFAAMSINLGRRGANGRADLACFSEKVLYLPGGKRKARIEDKFLAGLYLGPALRTDEVYIGTEVGALRARTFKRLTVEQRADKVADLPPRAPRVGRPPAGPRAAYIRKDVEIAKYGAHSAERRARIEQAMQDDEEAKQRLEDARERKRHRTDVAGPVYQGGGSSGSGGPAPAQQAPPAPEAAAAADAAMAPEPHDPGDDNMQEEISALLLPLGYSGRKADVMEVFCPNRLVGFAPLFGLVHGGSFDLRVGWDLTDRQQQRQRRELIEHYEVYFILGSPRCAPFSMLKYLSEDTEKQREAYAIGYEHLRLVMGLYTLQVKNDRAFLHEHPWSADGWDLDIVKDVMALPGVEVGRGDQRAFGPVVADAHGDGLAKKPTGWMSNNKEVLDEVCKRCHNDIGIGSKHQHSTFVGRNMRVAERCPVKLLRAILRGLRRHLGNKKDLALSALDAGPNVDDEEISLKDFVGRWRDTLRTEFHDDLTGPPLDPTLVKAARRLEMDFMPSSTKRLGYLAFDRPEVQFTAKECARGMQKPTERHLRLLKRAGRFLIGAPRAIWKWGRQRAPTVMNIYSNTDWAGCPITRRSTSSVVIKHGQHLIVTASTIQIPISMSSGEAEFYGSVRAASRAIGMQSLCQGLGSRANPADLGTKFLDQAAMLRGLKMMNVELSDAPLSSALQAK
ncbi:unnamed protein product, partial [Prorocentrum cordatum]